MMGETAFYCICIVVFIALTGAIFYVTRSEWKPEPIKKHRSVCFIPASYADVKNYMDADKRFKQIHHDRQYGFYIDDKPVAIFRYKGLWGGWRVNRETDTETDNMMTRGVVSTVADLEREIIELTEKPTIDE